MKFSAIKTLTFILLLFGACKEETKEPDPMVDTLFSAAGSYSGIVSYYTLDGSELNDYADGPFTVEFVVSKGLSEGTFAIDIIKFNGQVGSLRINGTHTTQVTDGFAFDVTSFIEDGETFDGYQGFEIEGTKYHGHFEKNLKAITFYVKDSPGDGHIYVSRYQGNLK